VQSAINIYKEDFQQHRLPYSEVQQRRQEWHHYQQQVRDGVKQPVTRYLTYADHMTHGLHNLLFSANLSGVHLKVTSPRILSVLSAPPGPRLWRAVGWFSSEV
jgi:hypothetical protein